MEHPLGTCHTADDLRDILRARFEALGVSLDTVDHIAGLPTRYTAKVLGLQPTRGFGQISLTALLGAAGIKLVAYEDLEALDRIRNRLVPLERIDSSAARKRVIAFKLSPDFMREIGRLGGLKSAAAASKKRHLSEINRAKALMRWQRTAA
jgi:hypothetical protein